MKAKRQAPSQRITKAEAFVLADRQWRWGCLQMAVSLQAQQHPGVQPTPVGKILREAQAIYDWSVTGKMPRPGPVLVAETELPVKSA